MRAKALGLMLDIPKTWNLKGAVHLLLQVLGLTKEYVLKQLEKRVKSELGEEAVARLQQLGGPLLTLLHAGPAALWKQISDNTEDLLKAAFDSVKGKLLAMLGVGVARFLAKLAIPGGAIVQVLESTYDVYQTVVARATEILKVGMTLFNAAQSLEQGNTRLAAKSIEGVLAQLLPVALDFLARTFQLDKLPVLVRAALQALRAPVDKGINWVVDKIIAFAKLAWKALKAGGKAVGQAGRDAVGAVRGWLGIHEEFTTVNGEHHELYFRTAGGHVQLVRASSLPKEITTYLDDFKKAYPGVMPTTIQDALAEAYKEASTIVLITRTADTINAAAAAAGSGRPKETDTDISKEEKITAAVTRLTNHLTVLVLPHTSLAPLPQAVWKKGPLPPTTHPVGAHQEAAVDYLALPLNRYGRKGSEPTGNSREMAYVKGQNWVRMHLISEALGGKGTRDNWVPAPTGINTGATVLTSFEESAKRLLPETTSLTTPARGHLATPPTGATPDTPVSIVAWAHVTVDKYYDPDTTRGYLPGFVETITFKYGLHRPPLSGETGWPKFTEPFAHQTLTIPKPDPQLPGVVVPVDLKKPNDSDMINSGNVHLTDAGYGTTLRGIITRMAKLYTYTKLDGDQPGNFQYHLQEHLKVSTNKTLKANGGVLAFDIAQTFIHSGFKYT